MKVLSIIQLPVELGGSYTTGVARVGEGLYKSTIEGIEQFWYFTNVKQQVADDIDNKGGHYFGYTISPLSMLFNILKHPINTFKQWHHYKKINSINPIRFEFYKANFIRVIKKVRPDLIHMHSDGVAPLYYANLRFNIPILMTFHGIMYEPETGVWEQNREDLLANIKMSDYYTALNKDVKRKALTLGVDANHLWIVPNGTNSSKFRYSPEKRATIRKQLSVDDDVVVFMTVGAVIDRKGQYDFLMLLEQLGINYQYWIMGKGVDVARIQEYVENHGIRERVRLFGYMDSNELYGYLSAADIYAHVSTTEGQAMSEIEAYSTGLPTIVRDMIKDSVIGDSQDKNHYLITELGSKEPKPRDEIESIVLWIKDMKQKDRCSISGCDWSEVARQYGEVYQEIQKRKRI